MMDEIKLNTIKKEPRLTDEPRFLFSVCWIFHLCRKAQHHLTEGQHHFERSENIISHSLGTNERGCASRK